MFGSLLLVAGLLSTPFLFSIANGHNVEAAEAASYKELSLNYIAFIVSTLGLLSFAAIIFAKNRGPQIRRSC
jgi:hypothetical protein